MKNRIKVFYLLFKIGFLRLSKYIEASFVNIISAFIFIFVQFFVWKAIMRNTIVFEYTFVQMFSYIIFTQVLLNLYPTMIGKQLSLLIKNGDISMALIKPLSIVKQLIYENIGVSIYKFIFVSLPILFFGYILNHFQLYISQFGFFIFSIVLSYFIFAFIDLIFGMLQFYTTSTWGINSLKYAIITLLSGQVLPINIYPVWCQRVINYLPFRHLYDTPLQILIGKRQEGQIEVILIEVIWLILLFIIFHVIYKKAIRNISVQGG